METEEYWIHENKIIFKPNFNNKLDNYLDIISKYNEELNCLPEFVEYLKLNKKYDKKIKKFPLNLKTIKCNKQYKYINDFKDKYNVITY